MTGGGLSLAALDEAARPSGLTLHGALHVGKEETCVLLGPDVSRFWPLFAAAPEYADQAPDPMDRWSKRVVGDLAKQFDARAVFPSDGPPYPPFIQWALDSGAAWVSPVGMLVHDAHGLWISYRGALALPHPVNLPEPPPKPCSTCHAPCLTACPVNAIGPNGYDTATCHAWLDTKEQDCMAQGCAIRRACPAGAAHGRLPEQSAFHMRSFHP